MRILAIFYPLLNEDFSRFYRVRNFSGINKMLGYSELEILSPDSMVDVEEDEE